MFALTLKSWNGSIWTGLARVLGRRESNRNVDPARLSAHMLRDLGLSPHDATDFLAAERIRFPI